MDTRYNVEYFCKNAWHCSNDKKHKGNVYLTMQTCATVPEQMTERKRKEIYIEKCNFS